MKEPGKIDLLNTITSIIRESREPHYRPTSISFSGGGEPLLYMKTIREYMKVYNDIKKETKGSPWFYLYTNGVLATKDILEELRDLGIDEIRFHLGASNFSKDVYKNVSLARKYFKALTVETPAWPPHKTKLFEMLPIIEDIGVDHVNIGEIEVTQYNRRKIAKILPDAEIYQCHEMHLYDNGLVYDIMEEALRRKYSYSVLDCNCFVKSIQRGPAKMIQHENLRGLFAGY
ncbi:MAG: hypothetical protein JW938_01525 [Candidatus Omnitrophica bacterium]|nr:hypothetical protein [Candidatus Omnitrophota bacterium]